MPECARCQTEVPAGEPACVACGSPLATACPRCGFESPAGFAFCGACGASLEAGAAAAAGERRHLSVMFCDLVDSTALAEAVDPEDLRELVGAYQRAAGATVERYEGTVAQYLGDGLLIYFGYPQAHEDDAQRAVRAGLEIAETIGRLDRELAPKLRRSLAELGRALAVRVGIHTGHVVVGDMGEGDRRERLALGQTPNIAARLQALAGPGEVLVSEATRRLVEGLFPCEPRGIRELKGVSRPVAVFRVSGQGAGRRRFEAARSRGLTPLVGRERELELLRDRWRRAADGSGQGVLITSDPGVGKSRLVSALEELAAAEAAEIRELQCSPFYANSALYPVADLLQRTLAGAPGGDGKAGLDALEGLVTGLEAPAAVAAPLLAALLGLDTGERFPRLDLTPARRKDRTLEILAGWLLSAARRRPVLVVVEDLHWGDPTTLELLERLLGELAGVRLLLVLTARPPFRPGWQPPLLTRLELGRLAAADVETLVRTVRPGLELPRELVRELVGKSDGVPLFAEELTKSVLDSEVLTERDGRWELTAPLSRLAIPDRLHDSLLARLDRLGPAKEVAQLAAVAGREFGEDLLAAVSGRDPERLRGELDRLVEAELLIRTAPAPEASYAFVHALLQDAAYESLLKAERKGVHRRIAEVLEGRAAAARPELLGHHWTEAGEPERAARYWLAAGRRAFLASANLEAVRHLTGALGLLEELPESPERDHLELELQMTLGPALMALRGFSAPEVARVYRRAHDLCLLLDETPRLFTAVWGLLRYYSVGADYQAAEPLVERLLRLARESGEPARLMEALRSAGAVRFHRGDFESARRHLEEGIALYESQDEIPDPFQFLQHPGLGCRSYAAWVLWYLGSPDRALAVSHEALALGRQLDHSYNLVFALAIAGMIHKLRREGPETREIAEAQMALSRQHGLAMPLASAQILRGGALVDEGRFDEGIRQMREGLAAFRATGAGAGLTLSLGMLAEACLAAARPAEGLEALAEAHAVVARTGERFNEPELLRIEGELRRLQGDEAGAEERFRRGLARAREQRSRALELRILISLVRLPGARDRGDGTLAELAAARAGFTEGAATRDLREADELLRPAPV